MTIFLMRHGETAWNHLGLYQGHGDPPLSQAGAAQIRVAAGHPQLHKAQAIITSPLLRACQSAAILAEQLGLPASEDRRLMELSYGQWEGLSQPEVKARWPSLLRLWKTAPEDVVFPEGGSLPALREPMRAFLADAKCAGKDIIAVTHQGPIRVAILTAEGRPLSEFRKIQVAPGSMTALTRRRGRWILSDVHGFAHPPA